MSNKIRQTSPDKINGKPVKYHLGDCLIVKTNSHKYIGAIMTGKFNKYYNFTLMNFYLNTKPSMDNFINGKIFGTRFGSWEELTYAVHQRMIECKYIDNEPNIEKAGSIELITPLISAEYAYFHTIEKILEYYQEEINIRIEKTKNAEKFPELAFVSKHLIAVKLIAKDNSN